MDLQPALAESLDALMLEMESRPSVRSRIPVVRMAKTKRAAEFLAFPGTVTVFVAPQGSPVLAEIAAAVEGGSASITKTVARLVNTKVDRPRVELSDAAKAIAQQPVFGEVRYGGRALSSSLFTPEDAEAVVAALPYNGGPLDESGLTFAQFYQEGSSRRLDAIAVVHPPDLTAAEEAALAQLPPDDAGNSLGSVTRCWAACAAGGALLVTLVATLCCMKRVTDASWEAAERAAMLKESPEKLGPSATARRLLSLRRQILREECPAG
ncbi:MAG: hypothetical protein ABL995_20525 [Bryobacteraceae bacterium]